MNAVAAVNWDYSSLAPRTSGVSVSANIVSTAAEEAGRHYFDMPYRGRDVKFRVNSTSRVLSELYQVMIECGVEGWDGYGAKAIPNEVIQKVFNYISGFAPDISAPEFSPEPDGELGIEWYGRSGSLISLSLGLSGIIHFAAVFPDGNRLHGTESYSKESQKLIEAYIRRIV